MHGKGPDSEAPAEDAGGARADLRATLERKALTRDEARPEAVERRHGAGRRTARENIDDLVDPGSFVEYGALAIAAQRARRELRELLERTPADGLVAGRAIRPTAGGPPLRGYLVAPFAKPRLGL